MELLELLNGAREELEDGDYRLLANLAWTRLSRELTDLEFERWRAEG